MRAFLEQVWPRFSLARFDGAVCFAKTGFCASFMCDHIPPSARNWPCRLDERAHIRTFVLFYRIGCDPAQVDRGRKERFYYWVGWDVPVSGGFRLRISARGMFSPESPMALARPRKRMKMAGCRVLGWQQAPALRGFPTPGPRPRIGVRGMLSTAGVTSREAIPDRSAGHAFIGIAHAGWRRHTKV